MAIVGRRRESNETGATITEGAKEPPPALDRVLHERHPMPERLTIDEAANYLGLPVSTLRHYRTRGEGPRSFKLGYRLQYERADLDAWITERKAATGRGGL